jgi:carbon monoxide dehydrogenase subunit G
MIEFTSEVKTIFYSRESVYAALSNMSMLEKLKDKIPAETVQDFSCDSDSCSFSIDPVGKIRFSIIEREAPKTIKLTSDQSPVKVMVWIQLKEEQENETKMKLTVQADLNFFLKPLLSKPFQEFTNKIADMLATINYDQLNYEL